MRQGALRWMFNWGALCVVCVFLSSYDYLKGEYPSVCVYSCPPCVCVCAGLCLMSVYEDIWSGPLHLWMSSFPSPWHLSLGRASCSVSLIKASTVWLMNRLCGISAPGWCSHSAAPRILWGPPFDWALNQETALITLPPSSSSSSSSASLPFFFRLAFLSSYLSLPLLLPDLIFMLHCLFPLSFLSCCYSFCLSLLSCFILGLKVEGGGGRGHLGASTLAYITAKRERGGVMY